MENFLYKEFVKANRLVREYIAYGVDKPIFDPVEVILFEADAKRKQAMLEQELILVGMRDELAQRQKANKGKIYKAGTIAAGVANTLLLWRSC